MQLIEPRPSRPIPIRITPLIDVVFILLVFFMLSTRLSAVNYLKLANDTKGPSTHQGKALPVLRINAAGTIDWLNNSHTLANLLPLLTSQNIAEVNLTTTPDASLTDFTQTLSLLDNAGIAVYWQRTKVPD